MHLDLATGWTVRLVTGDAPDHLAGHLDGVPATVPGVVHTDLLTAGLITDPFVDDAEASLRWIGESDWEYRTSFEWSDTGDTRHDLVAEGLDTVAHIELNGHILVPLQNVASLHCTSRCDAQDDWPPRGLLDEDDGSGDDAP